MIATFKPSIKRKDMDSVLSCLVSDVIGPAGLSERLLKVLSERLNGSGGYALREYPRAIAVALEALGVQPGARVALSPLLPWVYHYVCVNLGLEPVYVDVDADSPVIDLDQLQVLEGLAAAVVPATLGYSVDLERLGGLGIPLIEDVSQGLGATSGSLAVGSVGQYTICGLEPEHIITAGGGAALMARGRKERAALKTIAERLPAEVFLPDMNAALGLIQALEVERLNERRREIAAVYAQSTAQSHHKTPVQHGDARSICFSYPVFVESGARDVIAYARKKDVEVIPAFVRSILGRTAAAREAADQSPMGGTRSADGAAVATGAASVAAAEPCLPRESMLPNGRGFLLRCLLFPLYPMLKKDEVALVQKVLSTIP
ncbi:MAG: DegT/DnrJ/EryC1/StrS aminotransferase family protein [Spirochaetaceae bacterium]|nr:MAG: DegT/DnrJ/EryC1/StrS aminotransferase family protein [Spirochaetaceae bacterium]